MSQENYMSRKNRLLKAFDTLLARVEPALYSWLGEQQASRFM